MKFFNITLKQRQGDTELIYPVNYQKEIGDYAVDHLYYDEGDVSMLLLCIKDENSANIARGDVAEVSETEAKTISEKNEVRTEKITDEAKIRRIEIQAKDGQKLTTDEKKAINPDDLTPGIVNGEILADRIDKIK